MNTKILLEFKKALERSKFEGDICLDIPTRLLNATDNSIYELMPQAVLQPKHINDVQIIFQVANFPQFKHFVFTPRGGGTGTNAQALTNGIVINTSRYMRKIQNIDVKNKTVLVESGVVLSELNNELKAYGLFFAPMISTADRATIGGMIATDAAGKGSLVYGKTSDHIVNIDLVMVTGEIIQSNPSSQHSDNLHASLVQNDSSIQNKLSSDLSNSIKSAVLELLNNNDVQAEINKRFPPLKRPLSGYNLKQCCNETGLNHLLCGSEGTLGFVAQATLKLLSIPKHKAMLVVHYATFLEALKDADFLIRHEAMAIEAVDEKVQAAAATLPNWPFLAGLLNLNTEEICVSNFIEFAEDDPSILEEKIIRLSNVLNSRGSRYAIIHETAQINQLWSIRSLAVGLVARMAGSRKPIAFMEDCIVPPENLYAFVQDLQSLLDDKGLKYAMYGHVDVGCIHVRPALDMQNATDRKEIRPITEEVIKLTNKYHGLLWGEHGKGVRGEFVQDVFGSTLYPILQKIKAIFDPENRLNPGKLVTPYANLQAKLLQIDTIKMRGELDSPISQDLQSTYVSSMLCNGNGACFNRETANVMCPSYKVMNDRIHSPKGRAMLVKEWLRSVANGSIKTEQKKIADIALNAMSGCLGCKGCSGKCPSQVSIPDLRTNFLSAYYDEYQYSRRAFREYLLAYAEHLILMASKFPRLWNFAQKFKLLPKFNLQNLPVFPTRMLLKKELHRSGVMLYTPKAKLAGNKPLVLLVDVFSGFFNPELLFNSIEIFKKLGFTPYVIYPQASGKALIVAGMIDKFKLLAQEIASLVNPLLENNIPVVGLENSITLMYRDEYAKFATPLNGNILTLAEAISCNIDSLSAIDFRKHLNNNQVKYCLLPHCTEQAILPSEATNWSKIFKYIGIELNVQNLGCCGMAGLYGHQKENMANSLGLYRKNWQPNMSHQDVQYLATGFSCRSQAELIDGVNLLHPLQALVRELL